jgi:hypothetical protein
MRLANYAQRDYHFSFLRIGDNEEVDLVIDRGELPEALVEIKSTQRLTEEHTEVLAKIAVDFPAAELFVLSNDPHPKSYGRIRCLHWKSGVPLILSGKQSVGPESSITR